MGGRREREEEVRLRWADEKKRVAVVSRGNRDAKSEKLCAGIRSFRNATQPLHTNCSSSSAPPPSSRYASPFMPLSRQFGGSSETG